jgi:hypothetical protein
MSRPAIEIVLKDDHGRNLVYMLATLTPLHTHLLKVLFGFKACEPFIPKYERNIQNLAQFFAKPGHPLRLGTWRAIHV